MLNPLVNSRDVRFVLYDMLKLEHLLDYNKYSDFDRTMFDATLELMEKVAVEQLLPPFQEADRLGCQWDPETKQVTCPSCLRPALDAFYKAGFQGIYEPPEIGGMGMPACFGCAVFEYSSAANQPLIMYTALSHGSMMLIEKFGTEEQKKTYVEKMMKGEWGGTMCLTEPEAGSDVGSLKAKAVKQPDGTYRITGQKIFISAGENDLYSNIIHPVLARIEGDPAGTKGISIFIVPKYLIKGDGSPGIKNDVECSGIEHKMGIKSCVTCTMSFGDNGECVGYLLGNERQGMKIMFNMMNDFRMGTAVQAQAVSSSAYHHAVTYAKNRFQGVDPSQVANPEAGTVPIIKHPDITAMLLRMKAYTEAQRALIYYVFYNRDLVDVCDGEEAKEAQAIIDLLVPVCKAGFSDKNVEITSDAMQVLGGYGFCSDYPVEQMMRNSKILAIFEGANGIQGIDLVMRKLLLNRENFNFSVFKKRIHATIEKAEKKGAAEYAEILKNAFLKLEEVVKMMKGQLMEMKVNEIFMSATPFRRAFYLFCIAWMHVWSLSETIPALNRITGKEVNFEDSISGNSEAEYYYGKILASRFYLTNEFPGFYSIMDTIEKADNTVLKAVPEIFTGMSEE